MKSKKGISLIVLIITIIVVIILAAVVILTISKNNPVESAKEATFKEDVRSFQDELNMYISNEYTKLQGMRDSKISTINIPATYSEMKTYISSYKEKYDKKLGIEDDKIVYFPKEVTNNEKKWLEDLNISASSNIPFDPVEWDNDATPEDYFLWDNDGITIIGLNEEKLSRVTKIRIPSKCKVIRSDFYSSSLTEDYRNLIKQMITIEIPDTVTEIGSYAFYEFNNVENIVMSKKITKIGEYAFCGCSSLTSITIPNSVTSIGRSAFASCYSLTSITLPDSVTSIGNEAFKYCDSLTSITIPEGVTSIGDEAFYGCRSLTSITIPNSVTSIGNEAFQWCENLTSITIPNSVTSIGNEAFQWCEKLTSITIPNSVTSIGDWTFHQCNSLTSINVSDNNKNYCDVDGVLFNKDKTEIIQYPEGKINTNYKIPNSVTSIGASAFCSCSSLTSITIPNGVTSIGASAFTWCSSLTNITIPNSVTSIGFKAFWWCDSLTNITYNGTQSQWNSINKNSDWNDSSKKTITCTDGVITL